LRVKDEGKLTAAAAVAAASDEFLMNWRRETAGVFAGSILHGAFQGFTGFSLATENGS